MVRYVSVKDQSPLHAWLEESSRAIVKNLIWDKTQRQSVVETLETLNTQKNFQEWSAKNNILALIGQNNDKDVAHFGVRDDIPFSRAQLLQNEAVGFSYRNEQLHFHYCLNQKNIFLISQTFSNEFVKKFLEPSMVDLTIVELNYQDPPQVLYSTLSKVAAEDLLKQTAFEAMNTEPSSVVLEKEVHLVKMENLIHLPNLKQKVLFSKKQTQYKIVTLFDILMLIWVSFCIVIVLNVLFFKKYELSDSPR